MKAKSFQNIFWRFIILFLIFYVVPNDLSYGFIDEFDELTFWDKPIIWFGELFLGYEFDPENLFKVYDTRFELSRYLFVIFLALITSIIWVILDHYFKKDYNQKLKTFAHTVLRYHIAIIMVGYGVSKVFLTQFGVIDIDKLEATVGEQSPMGLMWSFLSFSKSVTMFSGWVELIGAVLLFFRKTAFLGALLLLGVLTSVVILDIGYDVSVTLYAIQLLLLVIVLLSNQISSLYKFIVLNEKVKAEKYKSLFKDTKYQKAALFFKIIILITVCVLYANQTAEYTIWKTKSKYSWFTAKHDAEIFVFNGDTIPRGREKDSIRWKKVVFNGTSYMTDTFEITTENNRRKRFSFEIDSIDKTIKFKPYTFKPSWKKDNDTSSVNVPWNILKYKKLDDKKYSFKGIIDGDTININTKAKKYEDYNLIKWSGYFIID